jgi:hypothetical protein
MTVYDGVKYATKLSVHDSGLLHALLGLGSLDALLAHPVAGTSPEGFAVETLINAAPRHAQASFYSACEDLQPRERWLVQGGADMQPYPVGDGVQAIGLRALAVRRPSLSESGHSVSTAVLGEGGLQVGGASRTFFGPPPPDPTDTRQLQRVDQGRQAHPGE